MTKVHSRKQDPSNALRVVKELRDSSFSPGGNNGVCCSMEPLGYSATAATPFRFPFPNPRLTPTPPFSTPNFYRPSSYRCRGTQWPRREAHPHRTAREGLISSTNINLHHIHIRYQLLVVKLLVSHPDEIGLISGGVTPGFWKGGIVPDDAADLPFLCPCIAALLLTYLTSPSSALKTSMLRAAKIFTTERGGAVVTHWIRIREDTGSIPGLAILSSAFHSFFEITPGECCDGSRTKTMADSFPLNNDTLSPLNYLAFKYPTFRGGNWKSPRKPADQRHRPARYPHAKIRSDPAGFETRIALVGGEQANHSATVAPCILMIFIKEMDSPEEYSNLSCFLSYRPGHISRSPPNFLAGFKGISSMEVQSIQSAPVPLTHPPPLLHLLVLRSLAHRRSINPPWDTLCRHSARDNTWRWREKNGGEERTQKGITREEFSWGLGEDLIKDGGLLVVKGLVSWWWKKRNTEDMTVVPVRVMFTTARLPIQETAGFPDAFFIPYKPTAGT
ncbi:hypothetical protein PR048_021216 [Dryococelus australis]|uniref:Uncharacterized protein n=1 Tax=Dryococelus australis TaxID=614101 RepID=A0ABQ9GXM1_9NEOP|nr:hypothetical protein PR048_021216 [Dryococelus australis]